MWIVSVWLLWYAPPHLLVINTATGPRVRNLLWCIRPLRIPTVGLFHDLGKIRSGRSACGIARLLSARVMLAEHLAQEAQSLLGLPVDHAHLLADIPDPLPREADALIIIPGMLDPAKRDLESAVALAADPLLDPQVRFVLLGRFKGPAAEAWWASVIHRGLAHRFIRFTGWIPQDTFDDWVARSRGVLPLIHPGCGHFDRFRDEKISGAMNIALGARQPLLLHRALADRWQLGPATVAYDDLPSLRQQIHALMDTATWSSRKAAIAVSPVAMRRHQQALYVRACRRALTDVRETLARGKLRSAAWG